MNIDSLRNCELLKKQFGYELFCRTYRRSATHEAQYEAAEAILRGMYPHASQSAAIGRLAVEWANDRVVMDTYLQLEAGIAEGAMLPNERQAVFLLVEMLDDIDAQIAALSPDQRHKAGKLRASFVECGKELTKLLGLGF